MSEGRVGDQVYLIASIILFLCFVGSALIVIFLLGF